MPTYKSLGFNCLSQFFFQFQNILLSPTKWNDAEAAHKSAKRHTPKHRVLEHRVQKHKLLLQRLSKTSTVDNIQYKNIY
jgi:hypothetical protein